MFTFLFWVTRAALYRQGGGRAASRTPARGGAFAQWFACFLLLGAVLPAQACLDAARAGALVETWLRAEPVRGLPAGFSLQEGACIRQQLVAALTPALGPVAGYKAALTSAAAQKRFGHAGPLRGVLLKGMLRPAGSALVDIRYGARPVIESDLLVEVADEAINDARTLMEVLAALGHVYPFVELADLVLAEGEPLDAALIVAINAGARAGIHGPPQQVVATADYLAALRDMRVVMTDESGHELAAATGASLLGHPLNAVLWLVADLRREGLRLKRGDLLSLGAFSPPIVPRPGMRVRVHYQGLPGGPEVFVHFR